MRSFLLEFTVVFAWFISFFATGCGHSGTNGTPGMLVINPQFDSVDEFSEGLAPIEVGRKWGYVDKQGKFAVNPQFAWVREFSDGLAAVGLGDGPSGKSGYIDRQGKFAINPEFESASKFSEGLAVVGIGAKEVYIDKQGKFALNAQFDVADPFADGLAGRWIVTKPTCSLSASNRVSGGV
jgi:hypothetical protein